MSTQYPPEHYEQVALFRWASLLVGRHPDLDLMFAVPNGGHRHKAVAGKLKAEGVKRGVPDVWLPVPMGRFHGLVIEMKKRRGPKGGTNGSVVTPEQREWLDALHAKGYRTVVCHGFDEARAAIVGYLALNMEGV